MTFIRQMAKGSNRPSLTTNSSRQIPQIRLYDDANLDTRYEVLNKLGEGSFGMVSRVRSRENHLFYAMKTIAKKVCAFPLALKDEHGFFSFVFSREINPKHQVWIMK